MQASIKMNVTDVWAQHPTKRFLAQPFFDSLKRWTGLNDDEVQITSTVEIMRSFQLGMGQQGHWSVTSVISVPILN